MIKMGTIKGVFEWNYAGESPWPYEYECTYYEIGDDVFVDCDHQYIRTIEAYKPIDFDNVVEIRYDDEFTIQPVLTGFEFKSRQLPPVNEDVIRNEIESVFEDLLSS